VNTFQYIIVHDCDVSEISCCPLCMTFSITLCQYIGEEEGDDMKELRPVEVSPSASSSQGSSAGAR